MTRRLCAAGALLAVVAAVAIAFAGGLDSGPSEPRRRDPHAGAAVRDAETDRILQAAEAAGAGRPRAALAAEGAAIFRSTELAKAGESCQGCHVDGGGANHALGTVPHPQEQGDFRGPRDVPSLWGVAATGPYGWAAQEPDLGAFVAGTIRSHFKTGETQDRARTARQTAALVAYLQTLDPPASAFDEGTLSPAARRGEELFQGKGGCMECHAGPLLTDDLVHATLVPKVDPGDTDRGAASGSRPAAFNTPGLRDVANTAPYMHNGSLKTLRDVVEFYDRDASTAPLGLTPAEVDDLVAYLESL